MGDSTQQTKVRVVTIGGRTWHLPFRAAGFWVEDARSNSVCDCRTTQMAVALAQIMNREAVSQGR